jgi:S-adenosylmethionine decarboxylase proenzyme
MKLIKEHGLHIIADLYGCNFSFFESKSQKQIKNTFSKIISDNNLHELGNFYYFFSGKDSFTAVVSLAESHLTIHTWPEDGYVSLDVFVCNYSYNQNKNAENVFEDILKIFLPIKIKTQYIRR